MLTKIVPEKEGKTIKVPILIKLFSQSTYGFSFLVKSFITILTLDFCIQAIFTLFFTFLKCLTF